MGYFSRGSFRQQASLLRQQFLQEDGLPFSNVFSDGVVAQALEAIKVVVDRTYSLVTLWVSRPSLECRPVTPCGGCLIRRCLADSGVLCRDRRLLPGQKASAGRVLLGRGSPDWAGAGNQRGQAVAMEIPPRLRL